MTEIGSIINTVARTAVITSMDMIIIMVDSISIMLLQNIFTGITKNGMGTINAGIIPEIDITVAGTKSTINAGMITGIDITIAGTKSTINAGMITGIDITIARVIGCTVIIAIIMIIVGHMKGPLSASK
jgi:hypothetical protein